MIYTFKIPVKYEKSSSNKSSQDHSYLRLRKENFAAKRSKMADDDIFGDCGDCGDCVDCCGEEECAAFCGLLYLCNTVMNCMNTCMACSSFFGKDQMSDIVGDEGAGTICVIFCCCVYCSCCLAGLAFAAYIYTKKVRRRKKDRDPYQYNSNRTLEDDSWKYFLDSPEISWAEYVTSNVENVTMLQEMKLGSQINPVVTEAYGFGNLSVSVNLFEITSLANLTAV